MSDKQRVLLKEKLKRTTDVAVARGLEDGTSPEFKTSLDEVENYSKLLTFTEPSWTRDSGAALAVAIIVVLLAGILWSRKVQHTNISLVAETDSLHATLARDWTLEDPLEGQQVHLDHLSALHNPSLGILLDDADGNVWFRLEGGRVVVQNLQVSRNASIDATSSKDELGLSISQAPFRGIIWVTGKGTITAGTGEATTVRKSYDLPVPETIEFAVRGQHAAGAELQIHSPQHWSLGTVPCMGLNFAHELRSLAERQILSGLHRGTLQFNDTSWPATQLVENQLLSISQTDKARIQIRSDQDAIHVNLNGLVGHVTLGDVERRRELAPSYLEYLYNKKSLALFWAAVAAGWGLLWGIRKTIFR
jgi:hypothetical protein